MSAQMGHTPNELVPATHQMTPHVMQAGTAARVWNLTAGVLDVRGQQRSAHLNMIQ
jgi:hypothetical protein